MPRGVWQEQAFLWEFKVVWYLPRQYKEGDISECWCCEALRPKELRGGFKSPNYTSIKYDYIGNSAKTKLLEALIMAYNMRYPFIIPTLVDQYASAFEDRC